MFRNVFILNLLLLKFTVFAQVTETAAELTIDEYIVQFEANAYVNDFAYFFNNAQRNILEKKIFQIDSLSSIQFAICTLDSLGGFDPPTLAKAIGNKWGVGNRELNNGITMVLAKKECNLFIATGLGTEKEISDEKVQLIIEKEIIPLFKQGSFFDGLNLGIDKIFDALEYSKVDKRYVEKSSWWSNFPTWAKVFNVVALILSLIAIFQYFKKRKEN